jgi:predicted phosphohydrolase
MAKYAWATDIHLDFLNDDQTKLLAFAEGLKVQNPDGIFLTGDLSVAKKLIYHLSVIEKVVQRPIYFILGNHDYYGADTEQVRKAMRELTNASGFLRYLPTMEYYTLTPSTAVVGHDGWYDGLYGDAQNSTFGMLDWTSIGNFVQIRGNKASILVEARRLAHESVLHVHNGIKKAVRYHKNVVVLTHYPPFQQCHMHNGKPGEKNATPWFTSKMMGDMLMDASRAFPNVKFTILCGHTHGKWDGQISGNLEVHVGGADYYNPQLQGHVEVA